MGLLSLLLEDFSPKYECQVPFAKWNCTILIIITALTCSEPALIRQTFTIKMNFWGGQSIPSKGQEVEKEWLIVVFTHDLEMNFNSNNMPSFFSPSPPKFYHPFLDPTIHFQTPTIYNPDNSFSQFASTPISDGCKGKHVLSIKWASMSFYIRLIPTLVDDFFFCCMVKPNCKTYISRPWIVKAASSGTISSSSSISHF